MQNQLDKALEIYDKVNHSIGGSEIKIMTICIVTAILWLKDTFMADRQKANRKAKDETLANKKG